VHEYSYFSIGCHLNGLIGRHRFPNCCREALVRDDAKLSLVRVIPTID